MSDSWSSSAAHMSGQISFSGDFDQVVGWRAEEGGAAHVMMCLSSLTEVLLLSTALITFACHAAHLGLLGCWACALHLWRVCCLAEITAACPAGLLPEGVQAVFTPHVGIQACAYGGEEE